MIDILNASEIAGKCQRNWSDEPVKESDIKTIVDTCMNMPTKQNVAMYELYVITDKDTREQLYDTSYVPELHLHHHQSRWRNGQMLAPLLFMWFSSSYENSRRNQPKEVFDTSITDPAQINLNAGISMGAAALAATQLGYFTGFNCCTGKEEVWHGIAKKYNSDIGPFICALGVGNPISNLTRNIVPKNKHLASDLTVSTEADRKQKIVYYI